MNAEERAFIKQNYMMLADKIDDNREFLKDLIEQKDKATCEKIYDIKLGFSQHDKRIGKLEVYRSYSAGKIAGISATVGSIFSILALILGKYL